MSENPQPEFQQNPQQNPSQQNTAYPQNASYQQQNFQQPPAPDFDAYGNPIAPDAKTMSVISHLSSLVLYVITASTLSFAGPLIFWFIFKNKPGHQFTTVNSARAFNFNFTMWIINIAAGLLAIITLGLALPISGLVWAATTVLVFIFHIIGAVRASRGEVYNYPMQIKILKD